jgi:hypothetical protein
MDRLRAPDEGRSRRPYQPGELHEQDFRDRRRDINEVIRQMRNGEVPWRVLHSIRTQPLDAILTRYEAAVQAGDEKYIADCAARPVDDAAWQQELDQCAEIERRRANR